MISKRQIQSPRSWTTLLLNLALMAEVSAVSVGMENVSGDSLTTSEKLERMNMIVFKTDQQIFSLVEEECQLQSCFCTA